MTVAEELERTAKKLRRLRATPCARCSHKYVEHANNGSTVCIFPLWPTPGVERCKCRSFVDSEDVLG